MRTPNFLRALLATLALTTSASAQDIAGTIRIERKLTHRSVTASIPMYQRGPTVKLAKDGEQDPLAFERLHVVIYLEGPGPTASDPAHAAIAPVRQIDRQFLPDIVAVPAGATVSFPNMDPIFHNIFSLSKPRSFDLGSYDKGDTRKVTFTKPGIVSVFCHLHPNMAATIVVTPNIWYAQSDRDGHFRIHDVPPGKYTVVAWHKSVGFLRKPIVVEAGHDATIDFLLPLEEELPTQGNG